MKIIITGATGFVGRNLAESLHRDGHEVVATGRSAVVGEQLHEQNIEFRAADIRERKAVEAAFSPVDVVIHSAAKSGPWGRSRDHFQSNVIGTRHVISACRAHGIRRIIFISTPSVYFTGKDRIDVTEDDPLPARQDHPYSRTKLVAENELRALRDRGFEIIIFRPRALYGPHDTTFIPRILHLSEQKKFPLINGGRALVDVTYIDNFVEAVKSCLTASEDAWNDVYNISNGDPITVHDWFAAVLRTFDRPFRPKAVPVAAAMAVATVKEAASLLPFVNSQFPVTRASVGYMAASMTMSIDKARHQLGYSPRVGNEEGFARHAEWFRSHTDGLGC